MLADLRALGIPCTEDDLASPSSEKVLFLLDTFSKYFTNVEKADLATPSLKVLDEMEFPELGTESVGMVGFCMHLYVLLFERLTPQDTRTS